jgi:hypothetical protein
VLAAGPASATTAVEDVNGGPSRGAGAGDPEAPTTTEAEDVDGGPWGCSRHVRQQPPLKLKTSMVAPLGGAGSRSGIGHHRS